MASAEVTTDDETPALCAVFSINPLEPRPCWICSGVAVCGLSRSPSSHMVRKAIGLQAVEHAFNSLRMCGQGFNKTACDLCLIALSSCSGLSSQLLNRIEDSHTFSNFQIRTSPAS